MRPHTLCLAGAFAAAGGKEILMCGDCVMDVKMLAKCIKRDGNCTDICTLTTSLIARRSGHRKHLLKEFAEVCDACTEECEKYVAMGM